MAKTSRTKKSKVKKKTSSRSKTPTRGARAKAAPKRKTTKKKAAVKKTVKKKTAKKAVKKKIVKKKATKKAAGKKTVKKRPATKTAKKATAKKKAVKKKTVTKKPVTKKPAPRASSVKKKAAPAKKPTVKPSAKAAAPTKTKPVAQTPKPGTPAPDKKPTGRKGITIVSKRPGRRPRTRPKRKPFVIPGERLLGPNAPARKPLIPSGPSVTPQERLESRDPEKPGKSPFGKRELTKYRKFLLAKRAELLGDMEQIESDALRSESGDLSHFPQHMADQGSDNYDQSLSLDLAAADRRLIKEIDDALARIADRTYGLCQLTGKPINIARLGELPWARYSIEAAREIERRGRI